jgi:hypothetical protein
MQGKPIATRFKPEIYIGNLLKVLDSEGCFEEIFVLGDVVELL